MLYYLGVVMPAKVVERPVLKGVTFRYLLAHAERPDLLGGSDSSVLGGFSLKDGSSFYEEFVRLVSERIPGYSEKKLLDTSSFIPQEEFKAVLSCFKELSGIKNPLDYRELGRVIPAVGDGVAFLAAMALNPATVIAQSPRYNSDFNNDQKIAVEVLEKGKKVARATIQHYMLPSTEPHYLEMVTAALGYWEGIPRLWGWKVLGETKLREIQIPLDNLVQNDFSYLGLEYGLENGQVLLNGQVVGRGLNLEEALEYDPVEDFLEKDLSAYRPVELLEDVVFGGEVVFLKGTKFGMPCSRYDVSIPHPGVWQRAGFVLREIFTKKRKKEYLFLAKTGAEAILSDQMRATQQSEMMRLKKEAEANQARAEAAEAKIKEVGALSDLESHIGRSSAIIDKVYGDVHDIKNRASDLQQFDHRLLEEVLSFFPEYRFSVLGDSLVCDEKTIRKIMADEKAPGLLRYVASSLIEKAPIVGGMIQQCREIMAGGSPVKMEIVSYSPIIKNVVGMMTPAFPGVEIGYEAVDSDYFINVDQRLLDMALTNLLRNAVEASLGGWVKVCHRREESGRNWDLIQIYQSGVISREISDQLMSGEKFTTKSYGNRIGFSSSRNYIERQMGGGLEVVPKEDLLVFGFDKYESAGGVTQIALAALGEEIDER